MNHQLKIPHNFSHLDCDNAFRKLITILTEILDNFYWKKIRFKNEKEWVDISIKNAVNKKQRLWHLYLKQKTPKNRKRYNEQAKKLSI